MKHNFTLPSLQRTFSSISFSYLLFIVTIFPLHINLTSGYSTIDQDKIMLYLTGSIVFYVLFTAVVLFSIFFIASGERVSFRLSSYFKKLIPSLSSTDYWVLLYTLSLFFSYLSSNYKKRSLIGADGWYMGLLFQLSLIGIYFIASRFLSRPQIQCLVYTMVSISTLIFLLAILNRYDINPLGISMVDPVFISTLGNIDWIGGYWSVIFPITLSLLVFYTPGKKENSFLSLLHWSLPYLGVMFGFILSLTLGADDVLMTLFFLILFIGPSVVKKNIYIKNYIELLFLFCIIFLPIRISHEFFNPPNNYPTTILSWLCTTPIYWGVLILTVLIYFSMSNKWIKNYIYSFFNLFFLYSGKIIIALLLFYLLILVLSTIFPDVVQAFPYSSFFTFSDTWGNMRGITMRIGMTTWWDQNIIHKLFGIGPDAMSFYLYDKNNISLYHDLRQSFQEHVLSNSHCDYITVLANLGIWGLISYIGLLFHSIKLFLQNDTPMIRALGFSVFAYMVYNIFSFQQIYNVTHLFIILGVGSSLIRKKQESS